MFEVWYWIFSLLFVISVGWYIVLSVSHLRQLRKQLSQKESTQAQGQKT